MAQRTVVTYQCDLDNAHEGTADEIQTVRFALDGDDYEMELCEADTKDFEGRLATYIENARRIARPRAYGGTVRGERRRPREAREKATAVRQWAKDSGLKINDRGRVPAEITAQYDAAGGVPLATTPPAPANAPTEAPGDAQGQSRPRRTRSKGTTAATS